MICGETFISEMWNALKPVCWYNMLCFVHFSVLLNVEYGV